MVKLLRKNQFAVTVFDNLSTGHRNAVGGAHFIEGDLRNPADLRAALASRHYDVVMHFAACYDVGESVRDPAKYNENNTTGSVNLLEAMRHSCISKLVFSSTCATYGNPVSLPMTERHALNPVNPYGASKLAAERAMEQFGGEHGISTISLRYFNAAGCDPEGELGERHEPETHLIPLVLREALRLRAGGDSEATELLLYGTDFDTPDGTCVRDFVHVSDLCAAHLLAMQRLMDKTSGSPFEAFNLGTGQGHSVKEVIATCRGVTGADIRYRVAPRRPGDTSRLIASADRARSVLDWKPEHTSLTDIVATAWNWLRRCESGSRR